MLASKFVFTRCIHNDLAIRMGQFACFDLKYDIYMYSSELNRFRFRFILNLLATGDPFNKVMEHNYRNSRLFWRYIL